MTTESLIWTLLPDGLDLETGDLRSTIFVTPRLRTGGKKRGLKGKVEATRREDVPA